MRYRIAEVTIDSAIRLPSFEDFTVESPESSEADMTIRITDDPPQEGVDIASGPVVSRRTSNGWYFYHSGDSERGLIVNHEYTDLKLTGFGKRPTRYEEESLIRMAIECCLTRRGYVSFHSACIELNGRAIAFSAPSGTGKSTRARAWSQAFGAELISGDRPLIDAKNLVVYGVPWDGKEQCFRNVSFPLEAILDVRRSESAYMRKMSFEQKRRFLMRQCFMPMWDTDTAVRQLENIMKLALSARILRAFCGPRAADAEALLKEYESCDYREEGKDLKATGYYEILDVEDKIVLSPAKKNPDKETHDRKSPEEDIPAVELNAVTAYVLEKLRNPMCGDDLLAAVMDEFGADYDTAAQGVDSAIEKLIQSGAIEYD